MRSQLCNILCWAQKTEAPHVCWMPLFAVRAHCSLWLSGDRAFSWCLLLFKQMPVAAPGQLCVCFAVPVCAYNLPALIFSWSTCIRQSFWENWFCPILSSFIILTYILLTMKSLSSALCALCTCVARCIWDRNGFFWERAMLCILVLVAYIYYGIVLSSPILCYSVFYTHQFFKKLLLRLFGFLSNNRNHLALVSLANVNTSMQILVGAL